MIADMCRRTLSIGLGVALCAALGMGCKKKDAAAAYDAATAVDPITTGALADAGIDSGPGAVDQAGAAGAAGGAAAGAGGAGADTTGGAAGGAAGGTATGTAGGTATGTAGGTATGTAGGTATGTGGSAVGGGEAVRPSPTGGTAPAADTTEEKKPPSKGMGASGGPAGREDLRPDKSP